MRRDLNRFRHRRRTRLQIMVVFTVAVLGALILVAMRSCTDRLDGMYQEGETPAPQSSGHPIKLDKNHLDRLKKYLEKEGLP